MSAMSMHADVNLRTKGIVQPKAVLYSHVVLNLHYSCGTTQGFNFKSVSHTWNMENQSTKTTFMVLQWCFSSHLWSLSSHGHNKHVLHGKELCEQYPVSHNKLTVYRFGAT